jgi:hypothetical protein
LTFLQKNCILVLKLHAFDRAILIEWDTDWGVSTYVIPLSPWTCASRPCRLAEVGLLCFFYLARSPRQVCTWQTYRVRTYSTGQFECSSSFLQLNSYFLKTDWLLLKLLWIRGKEEWVTYVTKNLTNAWLAPSSARIKHGKSLWRGLHDQLTTSRSLQPIENRACGSVLSTFITLGHRCLLHPRG